MLITAKIIHMIETVNKALKMMWKQSWLKYQHLPDATMQNHQNSQSRQKVFRPRSTSRTLRTQRISVTITFSNHLF